MRPAQISRCTSALTLIASSERKETLVPFAAFRRRSARRTPGGSGLSEGTGSHRSAGRTVAALALCAIALGACASSGKHAFPSTSAGSSTTAATRHAETTTTEPPSTDRGAISPVINRLLRSWDRAMTPILATPKSVAANPNDPLRAPLKVVFTADSPYLSDFTKYLSSGYVHQNLGTRPGPSHLVQRTTLIRLTAAPDSDHLSFVFCTFNDGEDFYLSTGRRRDANVGITQGTGKAIRIDGQWKLYQLQLLTFASKPPGTHNICPTLVAPPKTSGT